MYHSIPSNETWHLSHSKIRTFHSFNFCKFTFFEVWINNKTRTISRLFHSHKKFLIALRAFLQTGVTEFFSLPYTSELVTFLPFHVQVNPKRVPISGGASRINPYRDYPRVKKATAQTSYVPLTLNCLEMVGVTCLWRSYGFRKPCAVVWLIRVSIRQIKRCFKFAAKRTEQISIFYNLEFGNLDDWKNSLAG